MIKPIDNKDVSAVINFLAEGFPATSPAFWKAGLENIQNFDCHREADLPIGYVMYSKGELTGVGLTPTRLDTCRRTTKITKVVNFSAWYVVEDQRWKMPLLLRAMMTDKDATYTDLTPAPDVQLILQKKGFSALNDGVSAVPTVLYSVIGRRRHRVTAWDPEADYGFSADRVKMLRDHLAFGCFIFIIEHKGQSRPLILKISKVRGIRAAQVIFLENRDLLAGALGGLCARLLAAGCLALFIDFPVGENANSRVAGVWFKQKFRRLEKTEPQPI